MEWFLHPDSYLFSWQCSVMFSQRIGIKYSFIEEFDKSLEIDRFRSCWPCDFIKGINETDKKSRREKIFKLELKLECEKCNILQETLILVVHKTILYIQPLCRRDKTVLSYFVLQSAPIP